MRLFGDQLVAYEKLQGMVPQQKVTVEHVHVHQGGQAIVGAVSSSKSRPARTGAAAGGTKRKLSMNARTPPGGQRRGWLKNGNPPGDFSQAPRIA